MPARLTTSAHFAAHYAGNGGGMRRIAGGRHFGGLSTVHRSDADCLSGDPLKLLIIFNLLSVLIYRQAILMTFSLR
jgi:hypothetical protein